jgi:predicted GH43/DUF377 family glycosyl hydrolase
MFVWEKIGRIFKPDVYYQNEWMKTHAQNPLPESIGNDLFRIHFATRDSFNRARGGFFDINIKKPYEILQVSQQPTLELGALGAFDDCGVMPSSIVRYDGKKYMYYTGWSRAVTVPFSFHIGLAISEGGDYTYKRYSQAPVLGRNKNDPYITGAPFVFIENNLFRMWYVSCTHWAQEKANIKPKHYYTIKYAESDDGITWKTSDRLCLKYQNDEYAIARPVVAKVNGKYLMYYSYRGGNRLYCIGCAESSDGIHWIRIDHFAGINVSSSGWDSEMICYPYVFKDGGNTYMLYNGNNYGKNGIGLAIAK